MVDHLYHKIRWEKPFIVRFGDINKELVKNELVIGHPLIVHLVIGHISSRANLVKNRAC